MKYLFTFLMSYGSLAHAMVYEVSKATSTSGHEINVMRMSGLIEDREWMHWMIEVPQLDPKLDTLFVLSSPGGNVPMGLFLIRKVEEFLKVQAQSERKTWIVVEGDCSSMCVPLYYTWENRFAIGASRIGLHGVSLGGLGFDQDLTDLYFHNIADRAQARNDQETAAFMNKMRAAGEFSSTGLTGHSAADLARQGSGLIPDDGVVASEAALIDLL
jgi:ATP-dependent protease ClpP protease subunit